MPHTHLATKHFHVSLTGFGKSDSAIRFLDFVVSDSDIPVAEPLRQSIPISDNELGVDPDCR